MRLNEIEQENKRLRERITEMSPSVSVKQLGRDYEKHLITRKMHTNFHEDYSSIEKM